jgi:hypothetical protein
MRLVAQDRPDRRLVLAPRSHPLRRAVEDCIRDLYAARFAARGPAFSQTLLALLDGGGRPICAAGLRTAADGFFSETYFDEPVEQVLSRHAGEPVARGAVFEVTTLASRSADAAPCFIRRIASLGQAAGFTWSFFTATERLRALLRQLAIPAIELRAADPARLSDRDQEDRSRWGSYYAHRPVVCAVSERWLGAAAAGPVGRDARHA